MTMEETLKKKYGPKRYKKLVSNDFRESVKKVEEVRRILEKVNPGTLHDVISEMRYGRAKTEK